MGTTLPCSGQLRLWAHAGNYCCRRLAARCRISLRQFERRFGAQFGEQPRRWLLRLRMERALELLRAPLDRRYSRIAYVAAELFYSSAESFLHAFRYFFGKSPGELLRRLTRRTRRDVANYQLSSVVQAHHSRKLLRVITGRKRISPGATQRLAVEQTSPRVGPNGCGHMDRTTRRS